MQLVGKLWWQTLGDESEVTKFRCPRRRMLSPRWEPSIIEITLWHGCSLINMLHIFSCSLDELAKILDRKLLLTETEIEMFLENSCTFYEGQIILLKGAIMQKRFWKLHLKSEFWILRILELFVRKVCIFLKKWATC